MDRKRQTDTGACEFMTDQNQTTEDYDGEVLKRAARGRVGRDIGNMRSAAHRMPDDAKCKFAAAAFAAWVMELEREAGA